MGGFFYLRQSQHVYRSSFSSSSNSQSKRSKSKLTIVTMSKLVQTCPNLSKLVKIYFSSSKLFQLYSLIPSVVSNSSLYRRPSNKSGSYKTRSIQYVSAQICIYLLSLDQKTSYSPGLLPQRAALQTSVSSSSSLEKSMEFMWIELSLGFAAEEDEPLALGTELGTASEEVAAAAGAAAAGLSATT